MTILYLLRALKPDAVAFHLADVVSAASGADVVFVCDESRETADTGRFDKVSVTPDVLSALGFDPLPDNWGWFWGDLCYYAAEAAHPGYDAYCMTESDVYLSQPGADQLVERLAAAEVDVIAGRLRRYDSPQKYSRPLRRFDLDPHWGCIFPVSRLSKRAVHAAAALRKEAMTRFPRQQINDEGILVGAIQRDGLSHLSLEDIAPDQVSRSTFETNPPHLFEPLLDQPDNRRLYHPVVAFDQVLARIDGGTKNYHRHRMRKVLKMADPDARERILAALEAAEARS